MSGPIEYVSEESIASITMDDGKVNVMSPRMQAALHGALDRAEEDGAVVLLRSSTRVFSAGFDLNTLGAGGDAARDMVIGGFELAQRLLAFPRPVVMACPGHAIAMGAFLLLSGDYRIAADVTMRLVANEVAIGLTVPRAALELLRHRLTPPAFQRASILSESFTPSEGVSAGFVDRVVPAEALEESAMAAARAAATLDPEAHRATKLRARAPLLAQLAAAIEEDRAELANIAA